ncbi:MAG TPA: zinc ribbon domain-containing protein [Anaerolineales bacterium]|nr:zinc ribbon domain-containing protein [Anaerolineales bacterium]
MQKRFLLLFLCLLIIIPVRVAAQTDLNVSTVEVDLWPEYDRPSILVIYRITLAPDVTLPAEVSLRIPARVGLPNAVAAKQTDGSLINAPYDVQESGDWGILIFQATSPELQIEYYDPALTKDGAKRSFEYRWPGDFAVDRFTMQVQQPMGATDMRIAPSFGNGATAADGFVYFLSEIGSISLGQTFSVNLEYTKESDDLSLSDLPISPSGPISESPLSSPDIADILPWVLGITGVVLLVGGGLWYWLSGKKQFQSKPGRRRTRKPARQAEVDSSVDGEEYIYCHQCGKRASKGDRFCRVCGTQLRIN